MRPMLTRICWIASADKSDLGKNPAAGVAAMSSAASHGEYAAEIMMTTGALPLSSSASR